MPAPYHDASEPSRLKKGATVTYTGRVKALAGKKVTIDHTTKLSALGVRYRRERRAWHKWDRGLVSGGAGQFLVEVVEQTLK